MLEFFAAKINSDQTEGRGPMITVGVFTNVDSAYAAIKGQGVMGVGDGDIDLVRVFDTLEEMRTWEKHNDKYRESVYSGWKKEWKDGYRLTNRLLSDPRYVEYKEKQAELAALRAEVEEMAEEYGES